MLLYLSLSFFVGNCQAQTSDDLPPIKLLHVPPGYQVEEDGYFMDESTLRLTYQTMRTYREERDAWEEAYYKLQTTSENYASEMRLSISNLQTQLEHERKSWNDEINKAKRPGIGIFVGGGYTSDGWDAVIGIGIVYKVNIF